MTSAPRCRAVRTVWTVRTVVWCAAVVVLVVNDHLLKGAGYLPGWVTGKLSDFAGLTWAVLEVGVTVPL